MKTKIVWNTLCAIYVSNNREKNEHYTVSLPRLRMNNGMLSVMPGCLLSLKRCNTIAVSTRRKFSNSKKRKIFIFKYKGRLENS